MELVVVTQSLLSEHVAPANAGPSGTGCSGVFCGGLGTSYNDTYVLTIKSFPSGLKLLDARAISIGVPSLISLWDNETGLLIWKPLVTRDENALYAFIPSMNIQGVVYSDVHMFHYFFNGATAYEESIIYWVKGLGIIQRTRVHGTIRKTEQLVRHG